MFLVPILDFKGVGIIALGQKTLKYHLKCLHLCSKDERRSLGFGLTQVWVISDRTFFFFPGWHLFQPSGSIHTYNTECHVSQSNQFLMDKMSCSLNILAGSELHQWTATITALVEHMRTDTSFSWPHLLVLFGLNGVSWDLVSQTAN